MTFFGAKVTANEITWIEGSSDVPVQFTSACLTAPGKKKDARVVLELCRENADNESSNTQVLGVLSGSGNGVENLKLELLVNCRMGLKLAGKGAHGAVVHVAGKRLHAVSDDSSSDDFEDEGIELADLGIYHANDIGSDSDSDSDESEDDDYLNVGDGGDENGDGVNSKQQDGTFKVSDRISDKKRKRDDGNAANNSDENKAIVSKRTGRFFNHKSGLRFQELLVGTGKAATPGRNVAIHFQLRLENGKVVDKSGKNALKFRLGIGEVIKGMDIGLLGMREGGERHLIVPPKIGYGAEGAPPEIPRNATLFFDVKLVRAW